MKKTSSGASAASASTNEQESGSPELKSPVFAPHDASSRTIASFVTFAERVTREATDAISTAFRPGGKTRPFRCSGPGERSCRCPDIRRRLVVARADGENDGVAVGAVP